MTEIEQYQGKYTGPEIDELLDTIKRGGADKTYVHTQVSIADVWIVTHNLNKKPSVSIIDRDGVVVLADILYNDDNTLTITFGSPTAGHAYCN